MKFPGSLSPSIAVSLRAGRSGPKCGGGEIFLPQTTIDTGIAPIVMQLPGVSAARSSNEYRSARPGIQPTTNYDEKAS